MQKFLLGIKSAKEGYVWLNLRFLKKELFKSLNEINDKASN
jgi:hypothetical protein